MLGLGGFVITFGLMIFVFKLVLAPGQKAAEEQMSQPEGAAAPTAQTAQPNAESMRNRRVAGGVQIASADVLGENIPLEVNVKGYDWATWGMTLQQVLDQLGQDGVADTVVFRPANTDFVSVVALNPDTKRFKIEYRFYNNTLFHIEVFYSDEYRNNSFNAFLLSMMTEYGRPYEQYATVDEMGYVILHVKWDTEDSLIELVGHPNGRYSLFLDNQLVLIQLEEVRKSEERLAF